MKKHYFIIACGLAAFMTSQNANAKISNVEELYGNYNAVYTWALTDNNGEPDGEPDFLINPIISAGDEANQIHISGLFPKNGADFDMTADQPIVGTVDIANQTITIMNDQVLGTDSYGTNTLYFQSYDSTTQTWTDPESVTVSINDRGDLLFPTECMVSCYSTYKGGGFWYAFFTLTLQPYSGSYAHDAQFYVGNYTTAFQWYTEDANGQYITPPVDTVNPVITAEDDDKYELEINNMFAYLSADIEIETDVLPSGDLKIDNFQTWIVGKNGYQLTIYDVNFVMPDYIIVYLDEQGRLIFPEEYMFSVASFSGFNFNTFDGLYGYLDLIMTNTAGVESIEFDENAPVKYFNLSGLPISNPQKGQIVIKRQGNKAVKMLAK